MKIAHFAVFGLFLLVSAGIYLTMKTEMDGQVEQLKADNERNLERMEKAFKQMQQPPAPATTAASLAETAKARLDKATDDTKRIVKGAQDDIQPALEKVKASVQNQANEAIGGVKSTAREAASGLNLAAEDIADRAHEIAGADPAAEMTDKFDKSLLRDGQDLLNPTIPGSERITEDTAVITHAVDEEARLNKVQGLIKAQPAIARVKESKEQAGFVVLDKGLNANLAAGDIFSVRRGTLIVGKVSVGDTILETECIANVTKLSDGASLQKGDELIKWDR